MFRKPSIADIYIKQLRTRFDSSFVPLFPPDRADIRVGTIGRFVDGAFERRGHLEDILGGEDAFKLEVPLATPSEPSTFSFHSASSVQLEPSVDVSIGGVNVVTARLSFTGNRAAVASFAGVVEQTVKSPKAFDELLWRLHLEGELASDDVVVWLHRRAASGTVLANRKGGISVEVMADPAVVGAILTFEGLGVGVRFGGGSQASWQTSGTALAVVVKTKGLKGEYASEIENIRGFDAPIEGRLADFRDVDVPSIEPDDVLDGADFDQPED